MGAARLELNTFPAQPQAGQPTLIIFRLTNPQTGQPIGADGLKLKHTKLMHLIVVNSDRTFYRHLHPESSSERLYTFTVTFPANGQYQVYNEFDLLNGQEILYRHDLTIDRTSSGAATTAPATSSAAVQQLDTVKTTLIKLEQIRAGQITEVKFSFEKNGQPFSELEPYLGEPSHMIVISENSNAFRHLHGYVPGSASMPMNQNGTMSGTNEGDHNTPSASVRYGPEVGYTLKFDKPGRYNLWAEFQINGKIQVFNYVLEVL